MEGSVNLQLSAKNVGVFEAFCNTAKPIQIINSTIEMVKPGKLPSGKTEIPFEFPLQMKGNKVLYETYHGVFVNIQYTLRCDMRRSLLAKDLTKTCEFIVHSLSQKGKLLPSPVDFTITPETLQNVKERASLPKFLIRGHLNSTNCVITQPLTGELVVESAEAAVKSIELQLVRVETCGEPLGSTQAAGTPCIPSELVGKARCLLRKAGASPEMENGVLRAMPGMPQRSRTSRSPTATSAGASPSPSTWCSPGSSPAPPWKQPTSKCSLK
ncbi:vacuolar protein sorting-associated protein 26C isoform X1 [Passer montanus]|uniref:vacuolar protein sorting-associated protein 26C isoform X1 n=1 Tax=Passer montanus TaxID=9160 RepID=UPI0019610B09|nr:vacuolar protein sorting-associated protein 26C isoform X1 [Passer montanus]